ncbi:MAG: hypothetical protein KatS3mg031_0572 [Chitinophagales bacterium]|nr:MAG: hypothetical protein KatS3mg031_0572 [Chitinophagales bacterium]
MKSKICLFVLALALWCWSGAYAQQRYLDEVFTDVNITYDVKYAENYSVLTGTPTLVDLLMDVYEPVGDTMGNPYYEEKRPLIILTHAGSFLPKDAFLPFGAKDDSALIEMCTQFAKRGWVAVSMNYRIGWNPLGDEITRKSTIINAVYRAMQDLKACVRYFRKDAATTNTFRIDPYRVAVGGSNSGGYVSLALGALNKPSELTLLKFLNPSTGKSVIDTLVTGGFDGEGGCIGINAPLNNPGYSSKVQVILNLGGAIGDTTWQEPGEPPIVSLHGMADPLTPYRTAVVIVSATGNPVVEVSGSHDLTRYAVALGNHQVFYDLNLSDPYTDTARARSPYEGLLGFPGQLNGYEPWAWYDSSLTKIIDDDNPSSTFPPPYSGYGSAANPYATREKAERYIDTIMNYFAPRALGAFAMVDSAAVETPDRDDPPVNCSSGIYNSYLSQAVVDVYPVPALDEFKVQVLTGRFDIRNIKMLDATGKVIRNIQVDSTTVVTVKRNGLDAGVYFLTVTLENGSTVTRRIIFE